MLEDNSIALVLEVLCGKVRGIDERYQAQERTATGKTLLGITSDAVTKTSLLMWLAYKWIGPQGYTITLLHPSTNITLPIYLWFPSLLGPIAAHGVTRFLAN